MNPSGSSRKTPEPSPASPSTTTEHPRNPGDAMKQVLQEARGRYLPTPQARKRLHEAADAILERASDVATDRTGRGLLPFEPVLVGSTAKDTWLPGHVDLDIFLLFDPDVPRERLEEEGLAAGHQILDQVTLRYAEHPYVVGPFMGYDADVVPAYRVESGQHIQSSVDRTPFHTQWVIDQIQARPGLTTEIRLMKAWLRGIDVYGAKTAQRGISGYLSEVLTIQAGGFLPALEQAQGFRPGTRIDPTGDATAGQAGEPLVVVDPVDSTRNAAAAVREDRLRRLAEAATAFLRSPSLRYFEPAPLVPPRSANAHAVLAEGGLAVVVFPAPEMREDARDPRLERAAASLCRQLERLGFGIEDRWGGISKHDRSILAVRTKNARLPCTRIHMGPPVGIEARSKEFIEKYDDHPDAMEGPFEMEWNGRRHIAVRLRERRRDLPERIEETLGQISLGKHIDKAIRKGARVLDLDQALTDPDIAPVVARLLIDLPPWSRQGHPEKDYPPPTQPETDTHSSEATGSGAP